MLFHCVCAYVKVQSELREPGSQRRIPAGKPLHIWGQSLYILSKLLCDVLLRLYTPSNISSLLSYLNLQYIVRELCVQNLVSPEDLDPLNRRLATEPKPATVVQVVIIAETPELQAVLANFGVYVQTFAEVTSSAPPGASSVAPRLRVFPARVLSLIYRRLGRNAKLGLSGRPVSDVGLLATSKLYSVGNYLLAFTPQVCFTR